MVEIVQNIHELDPEFSVMEVIIKNLSACQKCQATSNNNNDESVSHTQIENSSPQSDGHHTFTSQNDKSKHPSISSNQFNEVTSLQNEHSSDLFEETNISSLSNRNENVLIKQSDAMAHISKHSSNFIEHANISSLSNRNDNTLIEQSEATKHISTQNQAISHVKAIIHYVHCR